jgi:hypothetical protein
MGAGCCGYDSNLAADAAGHMQLAWDSNATGFLGVWSQAVDPASGAPSGAAMLMPGSVTVYSGAPAHAQGSGRTPIVAAPGQPGRFFVAYPAGYPSLTKVLLWPVGATSAVTIADEPQAHGAVSLAADPAGRLWVFWATRSVSGASHVFARRVSGAGLEPLIDLGAPAGTASISRLDGDVSPAGDPEALALVGLANGATGTYYARGPQVGPVPPPVLGKAVDVKLLSGRVFIKPPRGRSLSALDGLAAAAPVKGNGFVSLTQARQIPVGSQIDARQGSLELRSASTSSRTAFSGEFQGAIFTVLQSRSRREKGLTTLRLLDGAFPGAPTRRQCAASGKSSDSAVAARLSSRTLQRLRARAHGRFSTRGRFSAATVRGTEWGTAERCDGTLTVVRRGTVVVTDFRRRIDITVKAGQKYLARAG